MTEAMYDLVYLIEHITLSILHVFMIFGVIKYIKVKGGNTNGS